MRRRNGPLGTAPDSYPFVLLTLKQHLNRTYPRKNSETDEITAANNSSTLGLQNHNAVQITPRALQSNPMGHCYHPLGIYAFPGLFCLRFNPSYLQQFLAHSSCSIKSGG